MISELRLAQIIAVITELSEQKKQDLYRFLVELKKKTDSIVDDSTLRQIAEAIATLQRQMSNKVDKVAGKGLSTNDFTDTLRTKLQNIVGNVRANWNEENEESQAYINNKPDLSGFVTTQGLADAINDILTQLGIAPQVQADWDQSDTDAKDYIKNKPSISGGGGEQIQSDWNQSDNTKVDFIKNKPTIPDTTGLEQTTNKVTFIDSNSTHTQYVSAKCVYTIVGNVESALAAIIGT